MSQEPGLTRRAFTLESALAMLAGVTITITGCSDDSPTTPTPSGNAVGTVSANHGHRAEISAAVLMTGNAVSLDITGSADHPHTVELSANEVMQIDGGQTVSKTSSLDQAHTHTVTFVKV